ncbi:MAG: sporulation protein YqfD [Ruminococcus sp.]|nr:sporulation protein YqfD [Ruminococcus sp.]
MQAIMRYLCGYVKIRIRGTSPERFLNLCRYHQILIWGLCPREDSYEMYVTLQGFRRLRPIIRKTHTKVILKKRYGLPFFLHRHRKRKAFLFGALFCMGLLYFYSSYIWDIHFEGNEKWTDQTLLAFLDTKEVSPCMPKKDIDCPQIVKEIRAQYDDIVWVSASIDGSRLKIQIKENEDTFQGVGSSSDRSTENDAEGEGNTQENNASQEKTEAAVQEEEKPTDLIASQDGVITHMITRSGVPVVHVGDSVKKGDLLVSGRVDVLNDAKEVIGYQYQQSDADIFADTQMEYEEEISVFYQEKIYRKREQRHLFYLKLGDFQISLGTVKHPFKKWETYTEEHQIKLGENFYLPAAYGRISVKSYDTKQKKYSKRQLQETLTERFTHFSEELEEKGIQMYENNVRIHVYEKSAVAKGTLYLNQRITEAADTEILTVERNEQDELIGTDYGNTGGT